MTASIKRNATLLQPFPLKSQVLDQNGLITPAWQRWHQSVTNLVSSLQAQAQTLFAGTSAAPLFTAASSTLITSFSANNTDSSAHTLTVYVVPSGKVMDNSTLIVNATSINPTTPPASGTSLAPLVNRLLNAGDTIYILSSAAGKIAVTMNGQVTT
jgi:hypothetical protein